MALGKILIADDDRNIAELLRLYLEKEGYTTELAADGEEAVAKFNADAPDLVLLDIMMPKLDGWQVCREIRKKSNCPIIMITAKGETFDKVQELAQRRNAEYFENLGRFTHLETTENILKGLVCCADCKRPLVRYKNVSHEKKLWYTFICPTHANDIGSCPLKNIREDALFPMLLQAIQTQIALATDMEAIVRRVNSSPKYRKQTATLQGRLDAAKKALKRCNGLYDSLYQSYVDKLMTEQEYMTLKRRYKAEAEEAERLIEALTRRQAAEAAHTPENPCLAAFGSFRGADALTKEMAQALIERVYVDGDSNIEIVFRYRDEYKELCTYLEGRKTDA